jgi:hypothetical protein
MHGDWLTALSMFDSKPENSCALGSALGRCIEAFQSVCDKHDVGRDDGRVNLTVDTRMGFAVSAIFSNGSLGGRKRVPRLMR